MVSRNFLLEVDPDLGQIKSHELVHWIHEIIWSLVDPDLGQLKTHEIGEWCHERWLEIDPDWSKIKD